MRLSRLKPADFLDGTNRWTPWIILCAIVAVGAYLRLWHADQLVNAFHDYEPAVYILDARSITQGYLPYRDFVLVHPPLYEYVLAAAIKIFGYSFFLGKYVSAFFSISSIVLIYMVGKKAMHSAAGLVAAALFAVSPDMVYNGGRGVQEALGIFLVLVGTFFALAYFSRKRVWTLFVAGAMCGLAAATKYTFIPAFLGLLGAVLLMTAGKGAWDWLKRLVRPSFIISYLAFAAFVVGLLFVLARASGVRVPVPFFSGTYDSVRRPVAISVTALSLVLPLLAALWMAEKRLPIRRWLNWLWHILRQKELWVLAVGFVVSFLVVTGFFWIRTPSQFLNQTLLIQNRYTAPGIPSIVPMIQQALASTEFVGVSYLPVLLALPVAMVLLARGDRQGSFFFACAIGFTLLFCQDMLPSPRYYVSVYPFFLLGLASMVPVGENLVRTNITALKPAVQAVVLGLAGIFVLSSGVTADLLVNYTGYDLASAVFVSSKQTLQVYQQTTAYLESVSPNRIWAPNPVYAAVSPDLKTTVNVDTTALVWLENESPNRLVEQEMAEGVDYVVLDFWIREIRFGPDPTVAARLAEAIRSHGHIVKVIGYQYPVWTEIWKLDKK